MKAISEHQEHKSYETLSCRKCPTGLAGAKGEKTKKGQYYRLMTYIRLATSNSYREHKLSLVINPTLSPECYKVPRWKMRRYSSILPWISVSISVNRLVTNIQYNTTDPHSYRNCIFCFLQGLHFILSVPQSPSHLLRQDCQHRCLLNSFFLNHGFQSTITGRTLNLISSIFHSWTEQGFTFHFAFNEISLVMSTTFNKISPSETSSPPLIWKSLGAEEHT